MNCRYFAYEWKAEIHEFHFTLYFFLVQVAMNELGMLLWVVSLHVKETEVSINWWTRKLREGQSSISREKEIDSKR